MEENPEDKIIKFPSQGEVKPGIVDFSEMYLQGVPFGRLPSNAEMFPGNSVSTDDFQSVWRNYFKRMLIGASLPEVPENILGIKNGTIIQMEKGVPDKGVHAKEQLVLFFNGTRIHAGGIDAPLSWTLDELIKEVNKGEVSMVGEIK